MITQKSIDQIFTTARVEEVIGDFVQLKKSGTNFKGLSPFSDEKTPSFMVSPVKQIWKDFSSGKGGNVVTFLMEHEQYTYPEALRWLAKRYNIEIEEDKKFTDEQQQELKARENLYTLTDFAKKYFQQQLTESEEGKNIGYSYFKERGFSDETIQKFELGYSPIQSDAFSQYALQKGFEPKMLIESGLSVGKDDFLRDRFRERVMFPIHSFSGRTLGFGARILKSNVKTAKYLNSPENEIYHKSKILYGIYQAKQAIGKKDECLLVEGYTDVISLHQSGVQNAVASSGTALTPDQIRLIKRLTNNIILVYDGDAAGVKASFRGIDLILEQEINVKIVLLPEGEDPDSFAHKHSESEIANYLAEQAKDFIRFKTTVLQDEAKNDPVKQSEMVKGIVESIALIPNRIQQEIYIRETASILKVREEILFRQLAIESKKAQEEVRRKTPKTQEESPLKISSSETLEVNPFAFMEEKLVTLMMRYGDYKIQYTDSENEEPENEVSENQEKKKEVSVIEEVVEQLSMDGISFSTRRYNEIFQQIKEGLEQKEIRSGDFFIKLMDEEISQIVSTAMMEKYHISDWEKSGIYLPTIEENLQKEMQEIIYAYKRIVINEMIRETQNQLQNIDLEENKRTENLKSIMQLIEVKKNLDDLLNRVV